MRKPEIEAIYLTHQEEEDAIYEGKVKKHFHQKAVNNDVKWDTEHPDFGKEIEYKECIHDYRVNDGYSVCIKCFDKI